MTCPVGPLGTDSGLGLPAGHARTVPASRDPRVPVGLIVGLLAGVVLVLVFLRLVDFGDVYGRLEHLDLGLALLSGVAFLAAYVVRALRWRRLLAPYSVGVRRVVGIYLVAIFINWLLPLRGGELAKSLLLRHSNGIPVSRSLPTVTMDKAMDLLPAAALLGLLPFMHLRLSRPLWVLLLFALGLLVLCVVVLAVAAWRRQRVAALLEAGLRVLPGGLGRRVEPFASRFLDSLIALARQPRLLTIAAGYTVVAVTLDAVFCWLAFLAVGESVALPVVVYGYTFYNLGYLLPTPPGQIGSNELVGLLVFSGLFGLSGSAVGAMFVFSHPWTALLMTAGGLVSLSAMGLSLRGTLRLSRAPVPADVREAL